jgi:hypothetical protein
MWNIQGLTEEKTDEHVFKNFVNKLHIVSFVETWNDSGKSVNNIPSFTCICNSTRKNHRIAFISSVQLDEFSGEKYTTAIKTSLFKLKNLLSSLVQTISL